MKGMFRSSSVGLSIAVVRTTRLVSNNWIVSADIPLLCFGQRDLVLVFRFGLVFILASVFGLQDLAGCVPPGH